MKTWMLLAFLLASNSMASDKVTAPESDLLGSWCARDEPAQHEEFVLEIEDGEHAFRAYLHHRPAEFGTWHLDGDVLTIDASEFKFVYRIERVSKSELVLVADDDSREYYFRDKCVSIDE